MALIKPSLAAYDSLPLSSTYTGTSKRFTDDVTSIAAGQKRYPEPINRSLAAISEWIDAVTPSSGTSEEKSKIDATKLQGLVPTANIEDHAITPVKLAVTGYSLGVVAGSSTGLSVTADTYSDIASGAFSSFTPSHNGIVFFVGMCNITNMTATGNTTTVAIRDGSNNVIINSARTIPASLSGNGFPYPLSGGVAVTADTAYVFKTSVKSSVTQSPNATSTVAAFFLPTA